MKAPSERGPSGRSVGLGVAWTTASFFCVAVASALGKLATGHAAPGMIMLVQNAICLVCVAPVALRHGPASLRTHKIHLHIVRALAGTASWYALFLALTQIPLSTANLLTFSAPLWLPVIAWLAFRRRTPGSGWIGAAVGFAGVLLVLQPHHQPLDPGELIALAAGVLLAVALTTVQVLSRTETTTTVLFYYFAISTVLAVPLAIIEGTPPDPIGWLLLMAIGIAQFGSQLFIIRGYRHASSVQLGPVIYSVLVFSALIEWLLWGQAPTVAVIAGIALVIVGGLITIVGRPRPRHRLAGSVDRR